jgi:hypothetical protein
MVKQKEQINAGDIQKFATLLKHQKRKLGIFISFSFSNSIDEELKIIYEREDTKIIPVRVEELLNFQ